MDSKVFASLFEVELNAFGFEVKEVEDRTDIIMPWSSRITLLFKAEPWLLDPQKWDDNWANAEGGCKRSEEKCDKLDETFLSEDDSSLFLCSASFEEDDDKPIVLKFASLIDSLKIRIYF